MQLACALEIRLRGCCFPAPARVRSRLFPNISSEGKVLLVGAGEGCPAGQGISNASARFPRHIFFGLIPLFRAYVSQRR